MNRKRACPQEVSDLPHGEIAVILVSPRVPENIGATARAMKNFGIRDLRIVAPRNYDPVRASRMARDGNDVLASASFHETIASAAADVTVLYGCSARTGSPRSDRLLPARQAVHRLLEETGSGRSGLLFGPEERGLTNRELDLCSVIATIPTSPEFPSLNLAQAVVVMCYEIHTQRVERSAAATTIHTVAEGAPGPECGTSSPGRNRSRPATVGEIDALFEHARPFLLRSGFLNPQNPDAVLLHFRKLLARAKPDPHEIRTLRGLIRQVEWYAERRPANQMDRGKPSG